MEDRMIIPNVTQGAPRRRYDTDLTDAEWKAIKADIAPAQTGKGRRRTVDLREVWNAIAYKLRTSCQWRLLPNDFPHHNTVSYYFHKWTKSGKFQVINDRLRGVVRQRAGRDAQPSGGVMDSQSAKLADRVYTDVGFDGGKKVKGRKRHVLVDTMGLLIDVQVTAANCSDQQGAKRLCLAAKPRCPRLAYVAADSAYGGTLIGWVKEQCQWNLEVIAKLEGQKGFVVLPKRWIVERSLSWLTRNRQLSREYDQNPRSSESWMYLASIQLLLRRLTKCP
jgi:putative transposase